MKEKNVVFPRGLCGFLAVLLLSMVSVLFPQTAQGYTFKPAPEAPEISQNAVDDPYYAELLERFPQHQKTVDALYADYSGWVIELAREYGIAPLLAMEALPEEEYPGLFRDAEIFNDIYESLDPKALSQGERAVLALRLTNVFLLRDPEKEYLEAFWKAQEQDRRASQNGVPSRRMTERFFSQGSYPENLWQELKKDSKGYDLLLELLSLEDREFLEAFVQYPNGASFLLNTGNEGIRLLEESDGEILALSCFLSHKEQRALPELCSRYPQLPKVLGASGFEAYFVVMVDPDFFFNLARAISGSEESKYLLAHAVLSRQMEAWKDPQELGKFLSSLSREQKDCLAFYVADFLDRFESSMEDEEAALPLAPLFDPYFFRFVHAYGERAVRLSQRFGDILPLGQIMMEDWRGEIRDITPVLDAIQDFDEMGLQAALEFRFNERMQDLVLGLDPQVELSEHLQKTDISFF